MDWLDNGSVAAVVGALTAALLGGAGYLISRWLKRDRSDLLLTMDGPQQAVALVRQPSLDGAPVYCESMRLGLIFGHNRRGGSPIVVTQIGIEVEPVEAASAINPGDYEIDVLKLTPHGIVDVRQYEIGISGPQRRARYIADRTPAGVQDVNPDNLLERGGRREGIVVEAARPQTPIAITVQADETGFYRVRFGARYTIAGKQKIAQTRWAFLYRKPALRAAGNEAP